jgi:hypothetical protein
MLRGEIIGVYCENHTDIRTFCGTTQSFWMLNVLVRVVTTEL